MWFHKRFDLKPRQRGFHLITREVEASLPELRKIQVGLCHLFLQHTSAALSVNENADPDVRADFESHFNVMVPENAPHYLHTTEGSDDMPAHIKSSLLGVSLMLPVHAGRFALGTWQGLYLCEHRDHASARSLVATLLGE